MTDLIVQNFNYNGIVIQRRTDGFVNLTQMCAAGGKRIDNYTRLKQTQEYVRVLGNYLTTEVVYTEEGIHGGTWGHPSLAINLARWISAEFAVWCDAHIFNLMTSGSTSLAVDPVLEMQMKIELARLERDKAASEQKTVELRHYVVTALPKPTADRILGVTEINSVEYRDRIIHNDDIINDGSTILKNELCHRYGLLTKTGKPDYKRLNEILEELPSDAFQLTARIQDNRELLRAYLPTLDHLVRNSNRQRWIGE